MSIQLQHRQLQLLRLTKLVLSNKNYKKQEIKIKNRALVQLHMVFNHLVNLWLLKYNLLFYPLNILNIKKIVERRWRRRRNWNINYIAYKSSS